jgi:Mor family transcriptional regulator
MAASNTEFEIICEIVGSELVRQIQDRIGGCKVYIPKDRKARRNIEIIEDYAYGGGLTICELVSKYDLSDPQIRLIIRENTKEKSLAATN